MDISLWIELILFVALMGLSGFFSSSETSLFSLNKLQLEQMRRDDNPRMSLIERMLSEPRRLIVTILIGNEFVNVAASVISAAVVIALLGAENKLVNLFIMVPILLLVGEITPKTLAIRNNVAFATYQSRPIHLFAKLITPVRWGVRLVADWFTTLIVGKERTRGSIITEDMVRVLAHEAVGDGVLHQNEARYVDRIFDFGNKKLEKIMTPRSNVFFLPVEMPLTEMVAEVKSTRHTKFPVYQGHRDNIVGILYARDLLGVNLEEFGGRPERVAKLLREPYFVPETRQVAALFNTFRKRKLSVALTVDEYGGVTGLATMEDLLECIFGEIPSPSDEVSETEPFRLADGSARIAGTMPLDQFNQEFRTRLGEDIEDIVETIGGLLLQEYGELPPEGVRMGLDNLEFEVVTIDRNRIQDLMVRKLSPPAKEKVKGEETTAAARAQSGPVPEGGEPALSSEEKE